MTLHSLDYYKQKIGDIFDNNDFYEAHRLVAPVMLEMSENKSILFEIVRQNISTVGYFERHYWGPIMGFGVGSNDKYTFVANCFLPRAVSGSSIHSTQSIHHHGNLLLTVIGAFGNGYEAIIFKPDFKIDPETNTATLEAAQLFRNQKGYTSFIDAYTPHIVFFPESLSISYSIWSKNKKHAVHALKSIGVLSRNKDKVKKILKSLGLLKSFGLQTRDTDFDFYPENGVLKHLKTRIDYGRGGIEPFVQNVFYVLQQIGFNDVEFWKEREATLSETEREMIGKWAEMWLKGEKIECYHDMVAINNPKVNFLKEDILKCIPPIKKEQMVANL